MQGMGRFIDSPVGSYRSREYVESSSKYKSEDGTITISKRKTKENSVSKSKKD